MIIAIYNTWFSTNDSWVKYVRKRHAQRKYALNDKCSAYLNLIAKAVRKPTIFIVGKWKTNVIDEANSNLTIYGNVSSLIALDLPMWRQKKIPVRLYFWIKP